MELHQRGGLHRRVSGHELAVVRNPSGIDMGVGAEAEAAGGGIVVLQDGVDDAAHDAALLVHLNGVFSDPGDDAGFVGVVFQRRGLVIDGVDVIKLDLCAGGSAGQQIGVHHLLQLIHHFAGLGHCGRARVAVLVIEAVLDVENALVGPAKLLEVVEEAVRPGRGPAGAVDIDGGKNQIQRTGEGGLYGIAPAAVKELRPPFRHIVGVTELKADAGGDTGADDLIDADADGAGGIDAPLELKVDAEILPLHLRLFIEALEGRLGVARGAQEEGSLEASLKVEIRGHRD